MKSAVNEASPQIYKPREGKIYSNLDKFEPEHLDMIYGYAKDLIQMFGYNNFFINNCKLLQEYEKSATQNNYPNFQADFNAKMLKHSIKLLHESDEVTSIYINYPALLLRKKCGLYPNGRTSHRFKN